MSAQVTILAIESSCDETAAAVLRGNVGAGVGRAAQAKTARPNFKILSSVVHSQISLHKKSGGVIPEVAARAHVRNITPVTQAALERAGVKLADIDFIAPTTGPGLIVSLMIGTEFAKGLAMATGKKMIPTNHMAGHLYSIFGGAAGRGRGRERTNGRPQTAVKFPLVALVASGGHTMLILMHNYIDFKVLGQTVDDAAGEAFDKVARLLGLPYPGGPTISKLALNGKASINFPRPMIYAKNFDFSFSGLKTAVLYYMRDAGHMRAGKKISARQKADIAASFEAAAIDVLITKTMRAAEKFGAKTISLSGGVASNKKLRHDLAQAAKKSGRGFLVPDFSLCTDNAAMIAMAAYFRLRGGYKPVGYNKVNADSGWEL